MDIKEFIQKAREIQAQYRAVNKKPWGVAEYMQGFVGDVGSLAKLIMAKNGFREIEGVNAKLAHELSDCLWSILIIADELGIDLEKEFMKNMNALKERIGEK